MPGSNQDDAVLDQTAMVLDGDVLVRAADRDALTAGNFQISGGEKSGFTQAQATELANVLKFGALPLSFSPAGCQLDLGPARP